MGDDAYDRPAIEKNRFHTHLTENLDSDWTVPSRVHIDPDACLPAHEVFRRDKRVQRQFWFLFACIFVIAMGFGYRSELNQLRSEENQQELVVQATELRLAIYNGCLRRQALAEQYNAQQGVVLPVEDCGSGPLPAPPR